MNNNIKNYTKKKYNINGGKKNVNSTRKIYKLEGGLFDSNHILSSDINNYFSLEQISNNNFTFKLFIKSSSLFKYIKHLSYYEYKNKYMDLPDLNLFLEDNIELEKIKNNKNDIIKIFKIYQKIQNATVLYKIKISEQNGFRTYHDFFSNGLLVKYKIHNIGTHYHNNLYDFKLLQFKIINYNRNNYKNLINNETILDDLDMYYSDKVIPKKCNDLRSHKVLPFLNENTDETTNNNTDENTDENTNENSYKKDVKTDFNEYNFNLDYNNIREDPIIFTYFKKKMKDKDGLNSLKNLYSLYFLLTVYGNLGTYNNPDDYLAKTYVNFNFNNNNVGLINTILILNRVNKKYYDILAITLLKNMLIYHINKVYSKNSSSDVTSNDSVEFNYKETKKEFFTTILPNINNDDLDKIKLFYNKSYNSVLKYSFLLQKCNFNKINNNDILSKFIDLNCTNLKKIEENSNHDKYIYLFNKRLDNENYIIIRRKNTKYKINQYNKYFIYLLYFLVELTLLSNKKILMFDEKTNEYDILQTKYSIIKTIVYGSDRNRNCELFHINPIKDYGLFSYENVLPKNKEKYNNIIYNNDQTIYNVESLKNYKNYEYINDIMDEKIGYTKHIKTSYFKKEDNKYMPILIELEQILDIVYSLGNKNKLNGDHTIGFKIYNMLIFSHYMLNNKNLLYILIFLNELEPELITKLVTNDETFFSLFDKKIVDSDHTKVKRNLNNIKNKNDIKPMIKKHQNQIDSLFNKLIKSL